MLSIAIQIHCNILSAQCYIRYIDNSVIVNTIQVECFSSELQLSFLMNDKIVKKVKIVTPNDFFVPLLLSTDSDSFKSGSTIVCRTSWTQAGQSVGECSFRLQVSGANKLDQSESELKVDVKEFFKNRFKKGDYWNLICASCGVSLPLKPVFIESVREYSESELSEGWFCHGHGPLRTLQPSSQILYLDDTSFYLYFRPDSDISRKTTTVLQKIDCSSYDTECQKDGHISNLNTEFSDVSHYDSLDINCSSKSAVDCCELENTDHFISQNPNSTDFSVANFIHGQQHEHLPALELNGIGVENQNDLDPQVLGDNSIILNDESSWLKQAESSAGSSRPFSYGDYKLSTLDKDEYFNGFKVLNPVVECQSCRNVLTSEKSSFPLIRYYLDKLMFRNSSCNDVHSEYARKIALLSFWSLVTRSRTSLLPCKLFLQSKVRGEDLCLLLWIPSGPLALFLLRDSLENVPVEINMEMKPVYKVLYFIGTFRSDNVRSWRHDFNVDFYQVSDTMVKTLAEILDSSSNLLPQTTDAGGFSCGFLSAPSQSLL